MSVAHQYEFAGVSLHGLQFISCFGGGAAMVGRPAAGPAASKKLVGRREADHAEIEERQLYFSITVRQPD